MKNFQKILIIVLLSLIVLIAGCGPKSRLVYEPQDVADPSEQLFRKAEKLYQQKDYARALEAFETYLMRYPNRQKAPEALMNIGIIYSGLGNYPRARDSFHNLIIRHPSNPLCQKAMVEILLTFYTQGKHKEVIRQTEIFHKKLTSRIQVVRAFSILGNSYMLLESWPHAVLAYSKAMDSAQGAEKGQVAEKLEAAVSNVDTQTLEAVIVKIDQAQGYSYLLYWLGDRYSGAGMTEEAKIALEDFMKNYPDHQYYFAAKELYGELLKAPEFDRFTVGVLLPLSGKYGVFGTKALKGIEFALNEFSQRQDAQDIRIVIKDTEGDHSKAYEAVNELSRARVGSILGPMLTTEGAATKAQALKIPMIAFSQKDGIPETGPFIFRNFMTPKMIVRTLATYAKEQLMVKDFAILYPDDAYGKKYMNLFWDEVALQGGRVTGVESYDTTGTDYGESIKKMVGLHYKIPEDLLEFAYPERFAEPEVIDEEPLLNPDEDIAEEKKEEEEELGSIVDFKAVFIPDSPNRAGLAIPQLAYYDIEDVYILGTSYMHSEELISMAKRFLKPVRIADGFFEESPQPRVQKFVDDFMKIYDQRPGFLEAIAYDSAMMLFETIMNPDIRSRTDLARILGNFKNYNGVTGLTSFDTTGEAQKELYMLMVRKGKFIEAPDSNE